MYMSTYMYMYVYVHVIYRKYMCMSICVMYNNVHVIVHVPRYACTLLAMVADVSSRARLTFEPAVW